MDCLRQYPWVTAAVVAAVLSLLFGAAFQYVMVAKENRHPRDSH